LWWNPLNFGMKTWVYDSEAVLDYAATACYLVCGLAVIRTHLP